MPTSGTHITIVQRLAADPTFPNGRLLGNPDPMLADTHPEAIKMRFACLGAVGPDIFYALADYGGDLQDLENFLVKVGGTFDCLGELMGKINRYVNGLEKFITLGIVDSITETTDLLTATIHEGILAVFASGVNLWPVFRPARQQDKPRNSWYWADYLHYIRSGQFARTLLDMSRENPNLHAYALGYLTHYVTDVVGHPYVNQVVGAPWRLAWQRHHLVENFIDAYVWDRWHTVLPAPPPPSTAEQPLDLVRPLQANNHIGDGAPFTFARLNDWINIGSTGLGDPVDDIVENVCDKIEQGLFSLGVVEDMDPAAPTDADFIAWTQMMADAIRATYNEPRGLRPMNLKNGVLLGGVFRPDGFPTATDVAAAYGVFRLLMRIATEEKIEQPKAPDVASDVTSVIQQVAQQVANDLTGISTPPPVPMGGAFGLDAMIDALVQAAEWAARAAAAFGKAVADLLAGAVDTAATIVSDAIKFALFLLNSALFALYRAVRDILVLQAYSPPYTGELTRMVGSIDAKTLWRSPGNPTPGSFPHEEQLAERAFLGGAYNPAKPLTGPAELPSVRFVAPYGPDANPDAVPAAFPDAFIDAPLGPEDMFLPSGPRQPVTVKKVETFLDGRMNFGGAIANSKRGICLAVAGFPDETMLPDYNLDGDRGYAWPCWDVKPRPTPTAVGDPLAPDAPENSATGVATVHAVAVRA